MRLKRLFKRTEPADPFAVFSETYGIRIPHDAPSPQAEPDEPQPVEPQPDEPQPDEPQLDEPQPHDAPPPKAEPDEPQSVEPGPTRAHRVLGVSLGASFQEVVRAHRKLALVYHPDRVSGMGSEARQYSEERMKEINAAYEELRRRGA
jgi:DnaJ-domain-containing protein 1